ncbi:MAG: peptide ABC transporter permease [Candidatus Nephthysia bennettiae]|uniref:ABC transporter permease n=1 Tax=Candidatus Nephthysia bennettiae TaxID=3127016 RepID=A0A934N7Y8_9BACT|nr:ABC transporter permease [Candidatus Dormibacteraeota bacterium]MBJ7613639.1 ABC transporter permease [Candidatus Dormibacteraeota bacterium]PZS00147.1 MAG: peptide ABC transporter permease [Candidatus Dormibacteraeota bacterium]
MSTEVGLAVAESTEVEAAATPEGPLRLALDVFLENRLALAGAAVFFVVVLFCFVGPLIYRTDQVHTNIGRTTQAPSAAHLLGTDDVGYDQLGRLMAGGQTSLEVALGAACVAVVVGVLWGAVAGFFGGFVDALMMRIVDAILAIPALFLLLFVASVTTPRVGTLIAIVGLIAWLVPARLIRGETLSLRTREYVQAVRVMGGSSARIILRHIVPNTIGTVMVNATFQVADAILVVAALSFLGLGIPPPSVNWGGMLSSGLNYTYAGYWWLIYPPGIAIVLTVVCFNFMGDALRDAFEVRLRRR